MDLLWIALCSALFGQSVSAEAVAPHAMRHYALLERALSRYEDLAREPQLTRLPPLSGGAIHPGEVYAGAPALRKLLAAVGDLSAREVGGDMLDASLVDALKRFQERHGLEQDGVLGAGTWRALTTPMEARVRQIEVTLARWRSLPANPYRRAIFINVPRFRLYAMSATDDREARMLQMNAVVGQTAKHMRTPVFSADLTHIVFRPYWDVPRSILLAEILPALRKDDAYLDRNDQEVVDKSGTVVRFSASMLDALESGDLRVRQRPGPGNALGDVKFIMPNEHDVYLHDTSDKHLFDRTTRAFSHGCIRVAEPAALARWLLGDDPAWTSTRIASAMNAAEPLQVNLAEPVRVYIVYATAIAREDGSVIFLNDLYGLDKD